MRRTDSGQRGWSGSNHYQQFCRGVDNFFLYRERGGRENRAGHFRQHLGNPTTTDERVFSQDLLHFPLLLPSLSLLCPYSPPLPFPNCPASPAARQDQVHTPTSKSLVNSGCKYNNRDAHARRGQATLASAESSSHVHGRAGGRKQCCLLQDRNKTFGESTSSSWLHVCCPSLYSCAHAHTHGAVGESSTCAGNLTSQCVLTMCTLRGVPSWRGMTRAICAKGGTG